MNPILIKSLSLGRFITPLAAPCLLALTLLCTSGMALALPALTDCCEAEIFQVTGGEVAGGKPSLSAGVNDTAASSEQKAEIATLFEHYMDKYNHYLTTGKLDAAPVLYRPQLMLMSNTRAPAVATETEFSTQIQGFLDSLRAKGVARVRWQKVNIRLLDSQLALASNVAERFRADGSRYNLVGATYLLSKQDGQWQIAAFAVHDDKGAFPLN
ncbi:hypothetical protein [Shewanella sp. FJAT-52076]|uniref:DUF6841 family protein n=1 Tax=Shewanella sp. FJAT-52076 TaxID=2864202 RepID=UPI001C655723|nr:hypothetical protein [Shewanella sp. FJAT-52076]QYJ75497.1 hypothetical protein K0H79_00345 [Shewanella sp. FJAT-52076]